MTHGTIKNNETGVELGFTVQSGDPTKTYTGAEFVGTIDGTSCTNWLRCADWTFTADPPPLPEIPAKVGSVLNVTNWAHTDVSKRDEYVVMLTKGGWRFACDMDRLYRASELRGAQERGGFEFEVVL